MLTALREVLELRAWKTTPLRPAVVVGAVLGAAGWWLTGVTWAGLVAAFATVAVTALAVSRRAS